MKRIYIPLFIALAFTACQDNLIEPEVLVNDNVMRFNLIGTDVHTKVSSDTFEAADKIGLYVTDYVNETTPMPLQVSGNRANNSLVTFDGAVWTPEQTIYWGNGKSDVYAYYPHIESVTDINNLYFEVDTDQTTGGYETSDFLWAKTEGVRQTDGAVNLEMKHLMSKLTVKIVAGEHYIGSLPEDATVQLLSTVTKVNIDLENGSVVKDPYSGAKSIKMKKLGIRKFEGIDALVYEAIVAPQMLEKSVPLLEINSKSVSYLLEDPFNFRPGVAYTYTVTLNASTTAVKVEIGCEIEDWNSTDGSGSGNDEEGDDSGVDEEDTVDYTDLSAAGTANCYLVQQAGNYKFKTVIGNTDATVGNIKSVEVLWESFGTDEMPNVGDLISSVSFKNGYIRFSTPENFRDGNATIAARNSKGTILWSWHIWCAEEGFNEHVYYNDAGTMMDRNLGALSATPNDDRSIGLMYQWGRKDPFLGSSSLMPTKPALSTGIWNITAGNTMNPGEYGALTEANPMTFYTDMYILEYGWLSTKSEYDPCPAGWRIPEGGENGVWAKALGSSEPMSIKIPIGEEKGGLNLGGILGEAETIWYPGAGCLYRDGYIEQTYYYGYYWSYTSYNGMDAYYLSITKDGSINPSGSRSMTGMGGYEVGFSVRCLKE